jgi:hypothetical protein
MQLLNQADFDKQTSDFESCPEILKLEDGQGIVGKYIGAGPKIEMQDTAGDEKVVATHVVQSDDGKSRVAIVSSHQLDKELPELVGKRVAIMKLGTEKTAKGRQVTKYRIKHAPN